MRARALEGIALAFEIGAQRLGGIIRGSCTEYIGSCTGVVEKGLF